mmetsp:Transcript_17228/g.52973  ORF Transcript_17228/g.52973 Transcript_17228/m.52973 type:complete len:231 (-) Transcript_17228:2701-3393(-)
MRFASERSGSRRTSSAPAVATTNASLKTPAKRQSVTFAETCVSATQDPLTAWTSSNVASSPTGRARHATPNGAESSAKAAAEEEGGVVASSRNNMPPSNAWSNTRPSAAAVNEHPSFGLSAPLTTAAPWPLNTTSGWARSRGRLGQGRDARSIFQTDAEPSAQPASTNTSGAAAGASAGSVEGVASASTQRTYRNGASHATTPASPAGRTPPAGSCGSQCSMAVARSAPA